MNACFHEEISAKFNLDAKIVFFLETLHLQSLFFLDISQLAV